MNPSSSPGKDGFTGYFCRSCWSIIKEDVFPFVLDFFKAAYMLRDVSVTTLVLISKITTRQLGDYRPISLDNLCGKIISKILASRLAPLLPKLVDEEHAGFVHGRNISQHIILAQQLIRDLSRKTTGGNIVFKGDMAKAYDQLE